MLSLAIFAHGKMIYATAINPLGDLFGALSE
jgi:hypothetical protein